MKFAASQMWASQNINQKSWSFFDNIIFFVSKPLCNNIFLFIIDIIHGLHSGSG